MFSRIEYVLTETFLSLRRHPMMAFAAITCIAATLFVAGIMALALFNAGTAVDRALERVRFVVFFYPESTRQETWAAYKRITALDRVVLEASEFRPKEQAWAKLQQQDPDFMKSLDLDRNPLPDSVSVQARDVQDIDALKREISQWPEVHSINDAPEVASFLENARRAVGKISVVVAVVLLLLSLVIIHHTIELTLYARRKEIHIMTLVGATPSTVALPFLLEGVVYGLLGGGIAFGCLYLLYHFFAVMMKSNFDVAVLQSPEMVTRGLLALAVAGICLGLSGSTVSVVKYLRRPRSKVTNA